MPKKRNGRPVGHHRNNIHTGFAHLCKLRYYFYLQSLYAVYSLTQNPFSSPKQFLPNPNITTIHNHNPSQDIRRDILSHCRRWPVMKTDGRSVFIPEMLSICSKQWKPMEKSACLPVYTSIYSIRDIKAVIIKVSSACETAETCPHCCRGNKHVKMWLS